MNYCHYKIKSSGKEFTSYSELLDYIDSALTTDPNLLDGISDIVFSKTTRQTGQVESIEKIKLNPSSQNQSVQSIVNGEPTGGSNRLSILEFLESDYCKIGESRLVLPFNQDNYIQENIKQMLQNNQSMSEEQAQQTVTSQVKQWEYLKNDSKFIHQLANNNIEEEIDDAEFMKLIENTVPKNLSNVAIDLKDQLRSTLLAESSKYADNTLIKNFDLKATIKGLNQDLYGHIDWMFIGQDGTLHLYLVKTSTENAYDWNSVKVTKYKYQLAFLKQMLAYNGINVKNMDLNIVPVRVQYDEKGQARKVKVQPVIQYSTKRSQNGYAMHKFDKQVAHFIADNSTPYSINSQLLDRAMQVNKAIFPTVNLKQECIGQSAYEWIKYAPSIDPEGTEPLVIKKVDERDHVWEVKIDGHTYNIKSSQPKERNPEILEIVQKHISKIEDYRSYSLQRLSNAVANSFNKGYPVFSEIQGFKSNAIQLEAVFSKYLNDFTENEKTHTRDYAWEMLPNLSTNNILVFKHKETGVVDVITLTAFSLNAKVPLRRGTTNILGFYKRDSEYIDLKADYGNVELVRTMELLNEILPELGNDTVLGSIGVLSATNDANFRSYNIGEFNKNYFQNIIDIVNKENQGLDIKNNFTNVDMTNPVQELLDEYINITSNLSGGERIGYSQFGFDELQDTNNIVQQHALENILNKILAIYPSFADPTNLEKVLNQTTNIQAKNIATLYELSARAFLTLRGESPKVTTKLNNLSTLFFTAPTVDSENIRTVVNNLQITHDTIADEFIKEYDTNIRGMFETFYKKQGYTAFQNMTIGNQAQQYSNLYNTTDELMSFKNPYDMSNDLKQHERELLKQVLFQIDKINKNGNSKFSSANDPNIAKYIESHPEYLWVPLERASDATKRQSKEAVLAGMKNFCKKIVQASTAFDEFVEGITEEERELLGKDSESFYRMHLKNPFSLSMPNNQSSVTHLMKERKKLLDKYGAGFFETNVENLMIDYLAKHISTIQYNKLLIASKALLLELHLTGSYNGNKEVVEKEIKYIQDYLKTNVFHTSIMSPTEKKIVGVVAPVKQMVSHLLLGGNIVSAVRDTMEGAQQNFIRSVIKLNTNINPKDVAKAYAYVWTHSTSNAMAQNLLSKLCLRYRISNTDVGRIAEKAKSGRNGIFNYENWMYSTLRGPDFLNRMTLFVAKCMHDGSWEAISLDQNGNLKYDWTKDKRFYAYKHGVVGSEAYKKAKALYMSKIREYNQEHPDSPLEMTDDLPEPYSKREINAIRGLGDNIYGSYDKGKRAMYENTFWGYMFGTFSTWMNGIVNNYFSSAQKNGVSELVQEQEMDDKGNKLFFDEHGNITTTDTGMPVYKNIPLIVQGIFPTVADLINITRTDGLKATLAYIKGNKMVKANVFKLTSDALMFALLGLLFKLFFTPEYKKHLKEAHKNPVLENLLTEVLYKSSSRAYDQFKGPINVIQFFGENMNPPYYTAPINLMKDAGSAIFGDKSFKYLLFDNTGLTRSMKDTAFAYIKSQQSN